MKGAPHAGRIYSERASLMPKIIELENVRDGDTDSPPQLYLDEATGRYTIRLINEGGFACTDLDLLDFLGWLNRIVPVGVDVDAINRAIEDCAARKRRE